MGRPWLLFQTKVQYFSLKKNRTNPQHMYVNMDDTGPYIPGMTPHCLLIAVFPYGIDFISTFAMPATAISTSVLRTTTTFRTNVICGDTSATPTANQDSEPAEAYQKILHRFLAHLQLCQLLPCYSTSPSHNGRERRTCTISASKVLTLSATLISNPADLVSLVVLD